MYVLPLPDLRLVQTLTPTGGTGLLAWSSDSRVLAIGQTDGNIASFDVRDGRLLPKLSTAVRPAEIHFLGHDTLLVARNLTSLRLLNVALGGEELTLNGVGPSQIATGPGGDVVLRAVH